MNRVDDALRLAEAVELDTNDVSVALPLKTLEAAALRVAEPERDDDVAFGKSVELGKAVVELRLSVALLRGRVVMDGSVELSGTVELSRAEPLPARLLGVKRAVSACGSRRR